MCRSKSDFGPNKNLEQTTISIPNQISSHIGCEVETIIRAKLRFQINFPARIRPGKWSFLRRKKTPARPTSTCGQGGGSHLMVADIVEMRRVVMPLKLQVAGGWRVSWGRGVVKVEG